MASGPKGLAFGTESWVPSTGVLLEDSVFFVLVCHVGTSRGIERNERARSVTPVYASLSPAIKTG